VHPFSCPNCKSRNVRSSLSQNFREALAKLIGIFQLRCRDCDERWTQPIWDLLNAFYARCPGCYGLELSLWQTNYYRPPARWKFLMALGARPRRCEFCRKNFVSFLPCKIRFVRRKAKPTAVVDPTAALQQH
jgi:hypothetical protein